MQLQLRITLLLRLAIAWIGFLLLWLIFVFQVTPGELVVGAIASGLAAIAGYVAFRAVPACFRPRLRWIRQAWHLPAIIATDLWLLLKSLMREIIRRPSRSSLQVTPFRATGEDCQAAAQRALAVLFVSTTPNSIVLDIDRQKGEMLFHQLEPAPVPTFLPKLQE
jgi:multisubunit Na+/H+ antiporter MnhE subunit